MPVHVCPRCQRTNPSGAVYCYHDGALLQAGGNGAAMAFAREFVFPSGRRCRSFDDLAMGCQEEWAQARDLLKQGTFKQFFGNLGRADLARAAQEAMAQADGDIGLTSLLGMLPVSRTYQPRLDIHPRRLDLGKLMVGDVRRVQFALTNAGQGQLQGTLKVTEGGDWLTLPGGALSCPVAVQAKREQKVALDINTQKLGSLQAYGGKLTVVTSGGVLEVPIRLDLAARPFGKPPFPGVKTPREMAEQMRAQPKAAAPLLESGEVFRWFAGNNWNYPVQGEPIKGVAGVQQFFEAMGLSKPPALQLSQTEVRFRCDSSDPVRFQVILSTPARKWVYALVASDHPWLKVLTPQVSGPQRATIAFEVETRSILNVALSEARLGVVANGGQKLAVKVVVESTHPSAALAATAITVQPSRDRQSAARGGEGEKGRRGEREQGVYPSLSLSPSARAAKGPTLVRIILMSAVCFMLLRLCLAPLADFWARSAAMHAAAASPSVNQPISPRSQLNRIGGWLRLPWSRILLASGTLSAEAFDETSRQELNLAEFRHRFVKHFVRDFVVVLWWLGPVLGFLVLLRRGGGWLDLPWGLLAGSVAGVVGSATLACLFLTLEAVPHFLWDLAFSDRGDLVMLGLWIILSTIIWTAAGALVGLIVGSLSLSTQPKQVPVPA